MAGALTVRILRGDCLDRLRELPDESVHCCVTSPPYYGLRDYGVAGQIGLEPTLDAYLAKMVEVFREVRRVLRSDGTLWLNIGDSYAARIRQTKPETAGAISASSRGVLIDHQRPLPAGFKEKDLMGVPWRLAFALQADGWYLRSDIIWAKKSCMPESVRDRPTKSHEHIFLLAKSESYYYDQVAASEPVSESFAKDSRHVTGSNENNDKEGYAAAGAQNPKGPHSVFEKWSFLNRHGGEMTRNWRDVWSLGPEPFKEAHFATFPTEIPRRAIVAGTSEKGCCASCGAPWVRITERLDQGFDGSLYGERIVEASGGALSGGSAKSTLGSSNGQLTGKIASIGWEPFCSCEDAETRPAVVLDPFLGSGTTALVADRLQRDCIGIELNPAYADMAERRIRGDAPLFAEVA